MTSDLLKENQDLRKRNTELQEEIAELRNNGFTVSAMTEQQLKVALEKGEQLEKENAELKKNYEDSLVAYGVLKAKVDTLAQPSPLESMQDALIATQKVANEKQKEQLTKAKEIIKAYYEDNFDEAEFYSLQRKAEQFLKE